VTAAAGIKQSNLW